MIEIIVGTIITFLLALISIYFIFFNKKKPDESEMYDTKSKQLSSINKKGKKKSGKKLNQNETGNYFDDIENDHNEIVQQEIGDVMEGVKEVIIPLKCSEDFASPDKKKRKNKGKQNSGDQGSSEMKLSDAEKNDNQSNTLLGRNSDVKLQDEITSLLKKLEECDGDRKKNENELNDIKASMKAKEVESEKLKSNLTNVTAQMNKLKSDFDSEKSKVGKFSIDCENTKKELENKKSEMAHTAEGHTEMYRKYESKIEELKAEIKTQKVDLAKLNQRLKEATDKNIEIDKKFNDVNVLLADKEKELKAKEEKCNTFNQMNIELKKHVEELQQVLNVKVKEMVEINNVVKGQKGSIERFERERVNKDTELNNVKRNELALEDQVCNLRSQVDTLNGQISTSKQQFSEELQSTVDKYESRINTTEEDFACRSREMDDHNNKFQVLLHEAEKEMDKYKRSIVALEDANECNKKAMDSANELKMIIADKDKEIVCSKQNEDSLSSHINELMEAITLKDKEHTTMCEEMKESIAKLHKEVADKENDKLILKQQVSSLKELAEKSQNGTMERDNIKIRHEEIVSRNTQLETIVSNLSKENEEKSLYVEHLKNNNSALLDTVACIRSENDDLKKRNVVKEEEILCQKANVDMSKKLPQEMEKLADQLAKKEVQVHELTVKLTELEEEKMAMVKSFAERVEEMNIVKEEIVAEQSVPQNSVCDNYQTNNHEEVENLKSHISKLEKELKEMQGRYYAFKEDSSKIQDKDQHTHQIVKSETHVVSIPPNDTDKCSSTSQEPHNDARSMTFDSLQAAINRLNSEIEEQRLTNQNLSGDLKIKENEVNILKQCLSGLDGSLNNIGTMANALQKSCSVTQNEKNTMKCQHDSLLKDNESLKLRFAELEKKWSSLNDAVHKESNKSDKDSSEKMNALQDENSNLRIQLEQYRESLEKTEHMLEKIQCSVDKEEADWTAALRSSEQECSRLEIKVKELSLEIDELKTGSATDASNMIASITSVDNGIVSSESKKKRKRKNKKKKNKNKTRLSESNGI